MMVALRQMMLAALFVRSRLSDALHRLSRGDCMQCPDAIPAAVGALSAVLAQGRSDDEISFLAALFTQLGDSLALLLASRTCVSDACPQQRKALP